MFALFTFETKYPAGGWNDSRGIYPSIDAAKTALTVLTVFWNTAQIVDLSTGTVSLELSQ